MPCYVTGTAHGDAELHAAEASKAATDATRVACEAIGAMPDEMIAGLSPEAQAWWKRHQKVDASPSTPPIE